MVSDGDDEEPTQTQRMNRALKRYVPWPVQSTAACAEHGPNHRPMRIASPARPVLCLTQPTLTHRPTSLAELQDLVEDQAHAFDAINLSHAFSRLAKLHRAAQPPGEKQGTAAGAHAAVVSRVLNSLVAQLPRLGSEFDCRDTATCLWALAALPRASSREHGHTFEMLCRRGRQLAVLMTPADAAMYMLAFGNLGTADPTLLHAIPQVRGNMHAGCASCMHATTAGHHHMHEHGACHRKHPLAHVAPVDALPMCRIGVHHTHTCCTPVSTQLQC